MLTADYLGMVARPVHLPNTGSELLHDPHRCNPVVFGMAGGCLDAPSTIAAGSHRRHECHNGAEVTMPTVIPRDSIHG